MSQPMDALQDAPSDDGEELTVEDIVTTFLEWNPTPDDEQLANLSLLLGLPYEEFETQVYQMFDETVDDDEETDDAAESEEDSDPIEPLNLFIISYFLYNPVPTDEQIVVLASTVGVTVTDIEERLLSIMSDSIDDGSDEDSELPAV